MFGTLELLQTSTRTFALVAFGCFCALVLLMAALCLARAGVKAFVSFFRRPA